jgi:hypothetical protein
VSLSKIKKDSFHSTWEWCVVFPLFLFIPLTHSLSLSVFAIDCFNGKQVAAYYYIKYTTIELFNFSLSAKTKMRGLIEILCNATEFEALPIRHKEDKIIEKLARHLPVKINKPDWNSPATKGNTFLYFTFMFSSSVYCPLSGVME